MQSAVFPMVSVCTVLALLGPLKMLCYDELGVCLQTMRTTCVQFHR
jgi:hypothetical protein